MGLDKNLHIQQHYTIKLASNAHVERGTPVKTQRYIAMLEVTGVLAAVLASVHLLSGKIKILDSVPRSFWLSLAGGIAVAYVFLQLLPELSVHQQQVTSDQNGGTHAGIWVYVVALLGLTLFYGLERFVKKSRNGSHIARGGDQPELHVYWLHVAAFAAYILLAGYLLLQREDTGVTALAFYGGAMALHFAANDHGLRQDHKERYDHTGRWILASAPLFGWALGALIQLPQSMVAFLFALLAGGIVLNVLKEELPEERKSRFLPFAGGAAGYATLILLAY